MPEAFTRDEADQLYNRVCDLVRQRDSLQEEVAGLRETIGLFDAMRDLMRDDTPVFRRAASNGHAPLPAPQGDDPAGPTRPTDPTDQAVDAGPMTTPPVSVLPDDHATALRSHNESDTGESAPTLPPPEPDAIPTPARLGHDPTEPPRGESEPGEAAPSPTLPPSEPAATVSPSEKMRPTPGTLMERIFDCIQQSVRPKRAWQIEKELKLCRPPTPELSRMVAQGFLTRPREGVYAIPNRDYASAVSAEGDNP